MDTRGFIRETRKDDDYTKVYRSTKGDNRIQRRITIIQ